VEHCNAAVIDSNSSEMPNVLIKVKKLANAWATVTGGCQIL